ncbi:MAG: DNA ligase [Burkholderiales bacterium PBB1]|nr:MAG: DNA ligase [Burkholderiales bacterium PBB1]
MPSFNLPCSRRRALAAVALAWPATRGLARPRAHATAEAPRLALLSEARPDIDPRGHLVSEKLDGVRALWDGGQLRLRSGRVASAPDWFTAALPPVALDGELWGGRASFDAVSGTVRRATPDDAGWRALRLMVFDLPGAVGDFAARAARIAAMAAASRSAAWAAVEQLRIPDRAALQQRLEQVVRGGGEGLVLHRADASWSPGRSGALWKLKPLQDAEAQVLAHEPGRGRLAGAMGALRVRTAGGVEFRIGTGFTDAERRDPPPVGSWISYTHRGMTATGLPRFASYWRPHNAAL